MTIDINEKMSLNNQKALLLIVNYNDSSCIDDFINSFISFLKNDNSLKNDYEYILKCIYTKNSSRNV